MTYKVLYYPKTWGNLMGQGRLSYERSEVAQAVWPARCDTCKPGLRCAGKWHTLAVGHLSHNTFKVTISR